MSFDDSPILVTGGTGFLGSRLVAALIERGARVRVLARKRPSPGDPRAKADYVLGEITERSALRRALAGVNLVFHLAAEKSIDRCELTPSVAIETNVVGTLALSEAARAGHVSRIVAASSDKACEPSSVLGATKFLMERILCTGEDPVGIALRLGGVLKSTGSVLERWERTRPNGFIELTDPEMTRFAMSPKHAVSEMLAASSRSTNGEILAPPLSAYRLGDLAEAYAARYGVHLSVIGRRHGERQDEAMVSAAEAPFCRREPDFFVLTPGHQQDGGAPYSSREAPRLGISELDALISSANEYA